MNVTARSGSQRFSVWSPQGDSFHAAGIHQLPKQTCCRTVRSFKYVFSCPATGNRSREPDPQAQQQPPSSSSAPHSADYTNDPPPAQAVSSSQQQQRQQTQQPKKLRSRELDVARAVQLLKLTTYRSDNKGRSKLPPWFTRTQEPDAWIEEEQQLANFGSSSQCSGNDQPTHDSYLAADGKQALAGHSNSSSGAHQHASATTSSNSSSRGKALQAIDDDYALPTGAAQQPSGNYSSVTSFNRRMFSASDPVKGNRNEWHLPWEPMGAADAAKEAERQYRRAVFSFDRWAAHRSTSRYIRHFRGIFSSRTFQGLLQPMGFFTGMAVLAGVYHTYFVPKGAPDINVSDSALDITAFAVSLLLVFRTDSSYARWEEALKTWNEVRSLSKDLARQSCYWVNELARKEMLVRWCEAFSRALLVHCRADGCLETELEDVLLPHEVAAVAAVGPSGAPSFVLQVLAELIEQCGVTEIKEDKMFSTVRSLGDTVAVCNKLLRYPLPLAYTRHTSRFMFVWLSAMPWAMWSDMQWLVVPTTAAIAFLLLGIDEIGVQIEEPFGILPLEDVCVDIQAEIDAMMERQDIVTDLLVAGGVDCEPRSTCGACGSPLRGAHPPVTEHTGDVAGDSSSSSISGSSSQGTDAAAAATAAGDYASLKSAEAGSGTPDPGPGSAGIATVGMAGDASGAKCDRPVKAAAGGLGELQDDALLWEQGYAGSSSSGSSNGSATAPAAATAFVQAGVGVQAAVSSAAGSAVYNPAAKPLASEDIIGKSSSSYVSPSDTWIVGTDSNTTAAAAAAATAAAAPPGSGSSSSSRSVTPGGTSRRRAGSRQSLVGRWVSNTMASNSPGSTLDPLSSLEDAPGPADLSRATPAWLKEQLDAEGRTCDDGSSSSSAGDGSSSSRTQAGRLGKYQRQPAPKDDRYPD